MNVCESRLISSLKQVKLSATVVFRTETIDDDASYERHELHVVLGTTSLGVSRERLVASEASEQTL